MAFPLALSMVLLTMSLPVATGHGHLADPPSRSSLYHFIAGVPENYDENGLNCGGLGVEYGGDGQRRCGVCGDPFTQRQPRDNEAGGKYGLGIISRSYQAGQTVNMKVVITANHRGYFEFRICPNNDVHKIVTQDCLDKYVLEMADGSGTRWSVGEDVIGEVTVPVKLPPNLVCSQCVVQWRYHAGRDWGRDPDGISCVGCGNQEEFYSCADVAIASSQYPINNPVTAGPLYPINNPVTDQPLYPIINPVTAVPLYPFNNPVTAQPLYPFNNPVTAQPLYPFNNPVTAVPLYPNNWPNQQPATARPSLNCHGINNFAGSPSLDLWCSVQCAAGHCPVTACLCP